PAFPTRRSSDLKSLNQELSQAHASGCEVWVRELLDVALLKTRVLAVELEPVSGRFLLDIYTAQLSRLTSIPLPGPAARVAALTNVPLDASSGAAGVFDFAVVSSGPITDPSDCQQLFGVVTSASAAPPAVPVPCGALYVIDVSPFTDLAHSGGPALVTRIPLAGAPFSLDIDATTRIATIELRGRGLAFVDLSRLSSPGLLDQNNDLVHDRLLGVFD